MNGPFLATTYSYVEALNAELNRRQRQDSLYSLRDFATEIKVDPSALSRILRSKQIPTLKLAREIAVNLNLDFTERGQFLQSVGEVRILELVDEITSFSENAMIPQDILNSVMVHLNSQNLTTAPTTVDTELYKAIIQILPGRAALLSIDGEILISNSAFDGQKAEAAASMTTVDWEERRKRRTSFNAEVEALPEDPTLLPRTLRLSPVFSKDGLIVAWLGTDLSSLAASSFAVKQN